MRDVEHLFSIRRTRHQRSPRQGRVLVVDSAPTEMQTVGPMFRLLLDWTIRYGMETENPVEFLLNEVDQLPGLSQLPTLGVPPRVGPRLAEVDDGWIYRKGMHGLDALEEGGFEEGIIQRPDDYSKGEDFWQAIEATRDRGAHIPRYEPS